MLLAVAGLDEKQITEREKKLAGGDWSSFSTQEQAAFAYAKKMSSEPSSITDGDVAELRRQFGPERMFDVIWWACRCHYMTRVADAFQLPLERENVFMRVAQPRKTKAEGAKE